MSAEATGAVADSLTVRLARALLTRTVRGRTAAGTAWGEAMLSEFEETQTQAEAVRWTVSSLPVAWRERQKRRSAERRQTPFRVRATRRIVISVVVAAIALVAVNWLVATAVYDPSPSMRPTYQVGERVLIDKVGFRLTGLRSGDIVAVHLPKRYPGNRETLRRVIGLPGDKMGCDLFGRITRNGALVPYGFLSPDGPAGNLCPDVTVPAGDVYVIGDNLDDSFDSRFFGPVPSSTVIGRASFALPRP